MKRFTTNILLCAMLGIVFWGSCQSVQAQSPDGGWSNFENISGTPTASTYPCIVSDVQGYVHVLWSEDVGGATSNPIADPDGNPAVDSRGNPINYLTDIGNTLYYARWDGENWLDPIDVQVNSAGRLEYPRAAVDQHGILHVIWGASEGEIVRLMYSQVPADKADLSQSWSSPAVLVEQINSANYPFDIAIDSKDGVHILYAKLGENPGTYGVNSSDGGKTWSDPFQIYQTQDHNGRNDGVAPVSLLIDKKDRLHATWSRYDHRGNGKAIYYSQSTDSGKIWSRVFEVAEWQPGWYETDWLSTGVLGDEIHLVWEGGKIAYQNERMSGDGGTTWGENQFILPNLVGENGFANFVVDSANQLHMTIVKRADPNSFAQGVWYTAWDQDHWSHPVLVGTRNYLLYDKADTLDAGSLKDITRGTFTGNGLRYQMSTIVNGNKLFVVVVNEYDGDIWISHTTLDAPDIPPRLYPQPTAQPGFEPTPTILTPTSPISQSLDIPTPTSVFQPGDGSPGQTIQPSNVLLFGVTPAVFVVIGLIAYIFLSKRKQS